MPSRVDGECNSRAAGKLLFVLTRALVYLGIIGRKWRRDLEGGYSESCVASRETLFRENR